MSAEKRTSHHSVHTKETHQITKDVRISTSDNIHFNIFFKKRKVGFITIEPQKGVDTLMINEDFQGKSIGKTVYRFMEQNYFKDTSKLQLMATKDSRSFWESLGYSVVPSGLKSVHIMEKVMNR